MLCLHRKAGERIRIRTPAGDLWVTVERIRRGQVYLGFIAPPEFRVMRQELLAADEGSAETKGKSQ